MADDPDKKTKPRFKERDEDDGDDDRPRKKKRADDEDDRDEKPPEQRRDDDDADEGPKRKRRDDDEDDRPKKKTRRSDDDGPKTKTNEGAPVMMLLALIGGALFLFALCAVGGWWSWVMLVGDGFRGDGGSGGNEFEVTSLTRTTEGIGLTRKTAVGWTVKAAQNPSKDYYYLVVRCGGETQEYQLEGGEKGRTWSSTQRFPGSHSFAEAWVERRTAPRGNGTRVSNVVTR